MAVWPLIRVLAWLESLESRESNSPRRFWPRSWRLRERMGFDSPPAGPPRLWLHAASLGEAKGLLALARALECPCILTVNTVTALDYLRRQLLAEDSDLRAVLAPLDHPRVVRRFIRQTRVRGLVFFEMELWPNFIREAKAAGLSVHWVSARWSPRAARRYGFVPSFLKSLLSRLDGILSQGEGSASALRRLGVQVECGPDLRGLAYLREESFPAAAWEKRSGAAFLSVHAEELPFLLPALSQLRAEMPLYVFPRKLGELPRFQAVLEPLGFVPHSRRPQHRLQILDCLGKVGEFLPLCHVAFIGGSYGRWEGHNLWEPLQAGLSMVIGPRHAHQEYLAAKLKKANLLQVSAEPLNPGLLRKSARDPGPECRAFAAEERLALDEALGRLREKLPRPSFADLPLLP